MPSSEPYVRSAFTPPVAAAARPWWRTVHMPLVIGCATMLPVLAYHWAGWPGGAAGWLLAMVVMLRLRAQAGAQASRQAQAAAAANVADRDIGSTELGRLSMQILPVWRRNLDGARSHSERSTSQLLESFAGVSGQLDQALAIADDAPTLELGAHDMLMEHHRPQIDQLMTVARQALSAKAAMQSVLETFASELKDMASLTRDVQNIGRATHLLALNTSVEATRAGTSSGGFMAVAQEVRTLAGESREAGSRLARHVAVLQERLSAVQLETRRHDADEGELSLSTERAARGLVTALLDSLTEATRATRNLHGVGRQLQGEIERVMVGLQAQDRFSQMIESVTNDMNRLTSHLHGARDELVATPADWLARLESSYTMEDMRSSHHGTSAIDQSSSVEFF